MQKKIESFFKPNFKTLTSKTNREVGLIKEGGFEEKRVERKELESGAVKKDKVLNKKRSYAQYHLELGQSDFLLHTCKVCGIQYAKGDEEDEKIHSSFHKNYTLGIPFKGWRHERVIHLPGLQKDRIVLVLNDDPPPQRKKVQEVVKMMEVELGEGWVFHERCEVYLYISSQRIAGCAFVEPITTAHRLISDEADEVTNDANVQQDVSKPTTLQFGGICFQREVSKPRREIKDPSCLGSIVCEEEPRPASCGVRAIWVSLSNRRRHIATRLLDAARQSFSADCVLSSSELAFSDPTAAGKALASKYTGTRSFLVYTN